MNGMSMNAVEVPTGTGSGFVWDSQGHIVTNFHVTTAFDLVHRLGLHLLTAGPSLLSTGDQGGAGCKGRGDHGRPLDAV